MARTLAEADAQAIETAEDVARLPSWLLDRLHPREPFEEGPEGGLELEATERSPEAEVGSACGRARAGRGGRTPRDHGWPIRRRARARPLEGSTCRGARTVRGPTARTAAAVCRTRSEERRVGKESRCG